MQIDIIAGTRPNFIKIAAIIYAIESSKTGIKYRLIHTGQHYDEKLSLGIFRDLNLPAPDRNLNIGSGSQAEQTGGIMLGYEEILKEKKPNICLVVGDVTTSMACAITAKKMGIKVVHVEAGLRSKDWSMPEEINRIIIDSIADYFFTTTIEASQELYRNGKSKDQVFFVGNTMIDTLLRFKPKFQAPEIWNKLDLQKKNYLLLTLHRPSNVDKIQNLKRILSSIMENSGEVPVIFPVHPRTASILEKISLPSKNLFFIKPLSYLEFNFLLQNSMAVLTDSGGVTEEATVLQIPCMTLRENTERPETVQIGTNEIIGTNKENIEKALFKLFANKWKKGAIPELWDGKTGKRIIEVLIEEKAFHTGQIID
ncbi:non-hydrolyzing UDP-N-acetylglucosamine 2-epimerase [Christiangramia echinicola]|uniref:non-hydrolyzing UDP-N-acetylglucosamine 2-epimerase n=1 Tax=Christiangramia echinicola TaxID=279359 RepID=UPI0003F989F0|nr:UDP-N-acetylglucosamine 2-epimerase (non-hydrolyzing) [Christiangramia echinicola]